MTKAEKTQLLFFVQNGVKSSCGMGGMAEQWAALEKRLPAPGDHAQIMSLLEELRGKGLICAQEAIAKGNTAVLTHLELTESGENSLYRATHRLWPLYWILEQCKDITARALAYFASPQ